MSDLQILRPMEVSKLLNVSPQTLYRMEKRGDLPKRIKISKRATGFLESDIREFLETKRETETEAA